MAEVEEPQFSTLAERIAALNKQKSFSSSSTVASASPPPRPASSALAAHGKRPPPPPPPAAAPKVQTVARTADEPVRPPLPVRQPTQPKRATSSQHSQPPSLPRRLPSNQNVKLLAAGGRRPSSDSVVSTASTATASLALSRVSSATSHGSSGSGLRKLPPAFGTTKLPPLPPSKREREAADRAATEKEAVEREEAEWAARHEAAERQAVSTTTGPPALPMRPGAGSRQASDASDGAHPRLPPRPRPGPGDASKPPPLPARRSTVRDGETQPPVLPARRQTDRAQEPSPPTLPSRQSTVRSAISQGFSSSKAAIGRWSDRANHKNDDGDDDTPPPLPMASRPSRAQIDAVVRGGGRSSAAAPGSGNYAMKGDDDECLLCRDFSGPDDLAARYPLERLPRQGTVNYLARHLCDPFSSQTDKARAIFTWCHHNVAYDVDGFFSGCIPRGQSITEQIFSGKAVCEGYAKIYEAIARAAGLEVRVVTGHGKGFGFNLVKPGQPVPPPNPTGHAWNAVRIDGGEWKLLDACWGAGNISEQRAERYEKCFAPDMFTMSNDKFGERHFPADRSCFFRADGCAISWAEYVVERSAEPPVVLYTNGKEDQFIDPDSVQPSSLQIHVSNVSRGSSGDDLVHFYFGRTCPHWKLETNGRGLQPYQMFIKIKNGGADGRSEEMVEVRYDSPLHWWADIPRSRLGPPGTKLTCFAYATRDGQDMRGASMADFRASLGRHKVTFVGICAWELV
ncbi:kyphoscoliosis peptidase [Grosmannia clavigera kw1407]|uniref:Kyphoscoliosis peptidase n=1 Tax=Grosmannia clavigera (strain kw1407 / UAMH 11150) TaxID=655863 RepID=F0XFK8_GROCL|nr:kyphoscoliosis peptidase [Grosmannia clavigera kw1407]EFX04367.1 kyphoscoliosis peptidase [Grosmannia clavigera kw1407]